MFHLLKVASISEVSFLLFLEETISLTDQTLNMLGNPWETSFWTNFLYRDKLGNTFINDSFEREPNFFYIFNVRIFQDFITAWFDVWLETFPVQSSKSPPVIFLLTVLIWIFFILCLSCNAVLSVSSSLVITCWERAGLRAFLYVMLLSHTVCWVRCGAWLYRFLIFAFFLTM